MKNVYELIEAESNEFDASENEIRKMKADAYFCMFLRYYNAKTEDELVNLIASAAGFVINERPDAENDLEKLKRITTVAARGTEALSELTPETALERFPQEEPLNLLSGLCEPLGDAAEEFLFKSSNPMLSEFRKAADSASVQVRELNCAR